MVLVVVTKCKGRRLGHPLYVVVVGVGWVGEEMSV